MIDFGEVIIITYHFLDALGKAKVINESGPLHIDLITIFITLPNPIRASTVRVTGLLELLRVLVA